MTQVSGKESPIDSRLSKHAKRMLGAGVLAMGIGFFSKEIAAIPVLWMLGELGYSYLLILRDGGIKGPLHSTRERQ